MAFLSVTVLVCSAADHVNVYAEAEKVNDGTVILNVYISEQNRVCGGSFNIVYAETKLKVKSAEVGTLLQSASAMINPEYTDSSVRLVFASTAELPSGGVLARIEFDIVENSGTVEFSLEKLKLADTDNNRIAGTTKNAFAVLADEIITETTTTVVTTAEVTTAAQRPTKPSHPVKETTVAETTVEEPQPLPVEIPFDDVGHAAWYYDSVCYAYKNGLMNGIADDAFAPEAALTRAMLVTILYRAEGSPKTAASDFLDVATDAWYSDSVAWAAEKEIVRGIGDGCFAPDAFITREQIAVVFYNYSKMNGVLQSCTADLAQFADADSISVWATDALRWAVGFGLVNGKSGGILDPTGNATRAEIAAVFCRYAEKIK